MTETWVFTNKSKVLFLTLTESGSTGYVLDILHPPYARHATEEDKQTAQYTEARCLSHG